jgi:GTP-binding protein
MPVHAPTPSGSVFHTPTHIHIFFSLSFLQNTCFFYFEFLYLGVISIECTLHVALQVGTAFAGEIVSLTGSNGAVTDTVCAPERSEPLPAIPMSPPVVAMTFGPNDSPLAGKEGSKLTSSMIKERLYKEIENNVTISLRKSNDPESIDVLGRGELQIGILVETMRREGFELTVSPPSVLGQLDEAGNKVEPFEEVVVDVDPEHQGMVIESMSGRKGNMLEYKDIGDKCRLVFEVPSRGMMGFRHEIISATRGQATINSTFLRFDKVNPTEFGDLSTGKLVSMENGKSTGYALNMIQERGKLFVGLGEEVYEGMVIGESSRPGELTVNPAKAKKLDNMRTTGADEKVSLSTPRRMTVEEVISYMDGDEVIEVTPKSVRLRKKVLDSGARSRLQKSLKQQKK